MNNYNNINETVSCCHHHHNHNGYDYPSSGTMGENAFAIVGGVPYVVDNTNVVYGNRTSVSEQVCTRVVQRRDISCITLDAKFDMTSLITNNTTLNHYVEQIISNINVDLQGVLPVLKRDLKFKLYYTIKDNMDDTVLSSTATIISQPMRFCATDVEDYYLTITKDILTINIPPMDFEGMYSLYIDKVEMYADTIDVKSHIADSLNPYYQFTDNNTKIAIQHDTIEATETDTTIILASCDVNYKVPFQANITTKMKMSFISYLSMLISTRNTFNIWNEMNDTVKNMIDALALTVASIDTRVTALEEKIGEIVDTTVSAELTKLDTSITTINSTLTELGNTDTGLQTAINENTTDITRIDSSLTELTTSVGTIETNVTTNTTDITSLNTRVTTLEAK